MEGRQNGKRNCNDAPRNKNNQFKKHNTSAASAITKKNLCFAWSVSINHPKRVRERLEKKNALRDTELKPKYKSVINDIDTAARLFSPKTLFLEDYIRKKQAVDNILEYNNEMVQENKIKYCCLGILIGTDAVHSKRILGSLLVEQNYQYNQQYKI